MRIGGKGVFEFAKCGWSALTKLDLCTFLIHAACNLLKIRGFVLLTTKASLPLLH